MQFNPLVLRIGLALVSVVAYAALVQLAYTLETVDGIPDMGGWFHQLVGAVFGALVLAPWVGPRQRIVRFIALCIASAAIYYLAIRFVTEGPMGYEMIMSFIAAGSGAALLSGLAVVVIAPQRFAWQLLPLTLVAGALGGAAFDLKLTYDPNLLIGHAAWQLSICLALYFSFRDSPPSGNGSRR